MICFPSSCAPGKRSDGAVHERKTARGRKHTIMDKAAEKKKKKALIMVMDSDEPATRRNREREQREQRTTTERGRNRNIKQQQQVAAAAGTPCIIKPSSRRGLRCQKGSARIPLEGRGILA